jgi:hypothetical protein
MPTEKFCTITQAARAKGVSRGAIYAAIAKGQIKTKIVRRVVRSRMVIMDSLESYQPDPDQQERGKKNEGC